MVLRRSDVIELIGEKALLFGLGGLIIFGGGATIYYYGDQPIVGDQKLAELLGGFMWVLLLVGGGMVLFASYCGAQIRKVTAHDVSCPYCNKVNVLTAEPTRDFTCAHCVRMIPVEDGKVLPVFQVRCGFCNQLNFYSAKNEVLICEKCDREIPLTAEEGKQRRHISKAYAVTDDENLYELVLVGTGHQRNEELIGTLQRMLALNRNQVKQILEEVPVTLLTGITRKKATMLQAQLAIHEGAAEFHPLQQ